MSSFVKVLIVLVLVVAIGAVVITKRSSPKGKPLDLPSGTVAVTATQPARAATPRLVDLGAGKCIPCKKMAPILEELKTEMAGKLQVDFIDVWVNPDAGKQYGIKLIPTQIFYDASGKELSRHEGFMPKEEILACFKEHGINLGQ